MADTIADRIVAAVYARLQSILIAGGYNTDAGKSVYMDRASLDSETIDYPALLVYDLQEDTEALTNSRQRNRLALQVDGFAKDADVRPLVGDVKKAVLLVSDSTISGLCHHLGYDGYSIERPEDGSRFARAEVRFWCEYDENYGDPYTLT